MTCEQCYVCEQTVLQCSRTMLLAMTYDLCHGGHMVAEYPLLHTVPTSPSATGAGGDRGRGCRTPTFHDEARESQHSGYLASTLQRF